ncbi:MAG: patatin-like phospholipase family protein [Dermatophilus congolensis]|nr:patatin-like phospholipase family protein [Dermatophilus congolensis]
MTNVSEHEPVSDGGAPQTTRPPHAPAEECDLIMKGGVTSGVVYPLAVSELSTKYRFRRIGGSSAGAIAAALTAAAEYRRHTTPHTPVDGFARLQAITRVLVDGDNLVRLFAPTKRLKSAFDLVMVILDKQRSVAARAMAGAWVIVKSAPLVFVAVTLLGLAPGLLTATALTGGERWDAVLTTSVVWVLPALVVGLIAAAIVMALSTLKGLGENGYGVATGHGAGTLPNTLPGKGVPPLTDWLHESINDTAGLAVDGPPLTFGDLWGPEATARYLATADGRPGGPELTGVERESFDPAIDLLVTTTCLTQGASFAFPFEEDTFLFCRVCLGEYLPDTVLNHLVAHGRPPREWAEQFSADCPRHPGVEVQRLPLAHELPVVLAARLSLSFPLLISAVPLLYLDDTKVAGQRGLVTAWFSDGGITSNLPLHFFDTPLPRRPTFGFNLLDTDGRYPDEDTYLPPAHGRRRIPRERRIDSVRSFARAVADTMQNWQDSLQASAPGFRDRIVEVYLPPDEGGLNLTMTDAQIESLAARGGRAGKRIVDEFDFTTHRWLRFRVAMNGYTLAMEKQRLTYPQFEAEMPLPWRGPYALPPQAEAAVRAQAEQLEDLGEAWRSQGYPATIDPPCPEPEFKLTPRR